MTFKNSFGLLVASTAVAATLIAPAFVFAQEAAPVDVTTTVETTPVDVAATVTIDPITQMQNDLKDLKAREADPASGFVTRFFIHLKIREIENKLSIATALK